MTDPIIVLLLAAIVTLFMLGGRALAADIHHHLTREDLPK